MPVYNRSQGLFLLERCISYASVKNKDDGNNNDDDNNNDEKKKNVTAHSNYFLILWAIRGQEDCRELLFLPGEASCKLPQPMQHTGQGHAGNQAGTLQQEPVRAWRCLRR